MKQLFNNNVLFGQSGINADLRAIEFVDKIFPTVPKGNILSTSVEGAKFFVTALTAGSYNVLIFVVCTKDKVYEKEIVVNSNAQAVAVDRLVVNDWYDMIGGLLKINFFRKVQSQSFHHDGIREVMMNFINFANSQPEEFLSLVKCLSRNSQSTSRTVSGGLPSLGKRR